MLGLGCSDGQLWYDTVSMSHVPLAAMSLCGMALHLISWSCPTYQRSIELAPARGSKHYCSCLIDFLRARSCLLILMARANQGQLWSYIHTTWQRVCLRSLPDTTTTGSWLSASFDLFTCQLLSFGIALSNYITCLEECMHSLDPLVPPLHENQRVTMLPLVQVADRSLWKLWVKQNKDYILSTTPNYSVQSLPMLAIDSIPCLRSMKMALPISRQP